MSGSRGLTPTNITREEIVPDHSNPAHDPRYWCLPPRRDPEALPQQGGRYPMYLVTQGRVCGIWKSWLVTKSMVDGYPAGAQRGHRSLAACVDEWQLGCSLGLHPHPVDPAVGHSSQLPQASAPPPYVPRPSSPPPATPPGSPSPVSSAPSSPGSPLGDSGFPAASESSSATSSTVSSITASSSRGQLAGDVVCYHAIWRERVVHSDRREAKRVFLALRAVGKRPRVLTTANYDEAEAFSNGIHWVAD